MKQINNNKVCIFCRVSTEKQEFERQIHELTQYADSKGLIITHTIANKISGVKKADQRPDIHELIIEARKGTFNKVLVTELSRLGRSSRQIRKTIEDLHEAGVSVIFKNLGGIESLDDKGEETFVVNIIISIWAEFSEAEKKLLTQRIVSGLQKARLTKTLGRPVGSVLEQDEILSKYSKLAKDLQTAISVRKCAKIHAVSLNTVMKVKKALANAA